MRVIYTLKNEKFLSFLFTLLGGHWTFILSFFFSLSVSKHSLLSLLSIPILCLLFKLFSLSYQLHYHYITFYPRAYVRVISCRMRQTSNQTIYKNSIIKEALHLKLHQRWSLAFNYKMIVKDLYTNWNQRIDSPSRTVGLLKCRPLACVKRTHMESTLTPKRILPMFITPL